MYFGCEDYEFLCCLVADWSVSKASVLSTLFVVVAELRKLGGRLFVELSG